MDVHIDTPHIDTNVVRLIAEYAQMADFTARNYRFYWRVDCVNTDHAVLSMGAMSARGGCDMFNIAIGADSRVSETSANKFDAKSVYFDASNRISKNDRFDNCERVFTSVKDIVMIEIERMLCRNVGDDTPDKRFRALLATGMIPTGISTGIRTAIASSMIALSVPIPRAEFNSGFNPVILSDNLVWKRYVSREYADQEITFNVYLRDVFGLLSTARVLFDVRNCTERYMKILPRSDDLRQDLRQDLHQDTRSIALALVPGGMITDAIISAADDVCGDYHAILVPQIREIVSRADFETVHTKNYRQMNDFMIAALGSDYIPSTLHEHFFWGLMRD